MNRRLALSLRRKVRAFRRLDVRYLGDTREEFTCRTCGHSHIVDHGPKMSAWWLKRFAAYRAQGAITGECPHCTKDEREKRYPLKGEE